MKLSNILALSSLFLGSAVSAEKESPRGLRSHNNNGESRGLMGKKGDDDDDDDGDNSMTLTLTIINESFNQPFSPFFCMVHNSDAMPLYIRGQPASEPLALLAEDGNPGPLVEMYSGAEGVMSAAAFMEGAPYFGGETFSLRVTVSEEYPLVTIATMAINTNDCFTSINGMMLYPGLVLDLPGLDAGSEINNELCNSIPGPGCAGFPAGNERSGEGEGFVHVHRGFHGVGDLAAAPYDWRNPMMRVIVSH